MMDPGLITSKKKPTLLYLVTEDWYFCSHRLALAREAKDNGFDIIVATRVTNHGEQIEREGFKLIPIQFIVDSLCPVFRRTWVNNLDDVRSEVCQHANRQRSSPDLSQIHHP